MTFYEPEWSGWLNATMKQWFGDYARFCFKQFGKYVNEWYTINEPTQICHYGHGLGLLAPGIKSSGVGEYICSKNILLAHATAWRIYDTQFRQTQKGRINIVLDSEWFEPGTDEDKEAAERKFQFMYGLYANPIYRGNWPQVVIDRVELRSKLEGYAQSRLPELTVEEQNFIKGAYDYLTINHYSSSMTNDIPELSVDGVPSLEKDSKVFLYPNSAWKKSAIGYSFLSQVLDAIQDGVNITGYTVWSIMDDFEWNSGYTAKFGLYYVNMDDPQRKRLPKKSVIYYSNVTRTRCIVDQLTKQMWLETRKFNVFEWKMKKNETQNDCILNKRFEFGIPLQDIFPPNDIHPRLKYLFEKAYQLYKDSRCNVQEIFRSYEGFLEECFKLKEIITFDLYYYRSVSYRTGTYFWLLRHFLGLLPIPLLPSYTHGTYFDWNYLAERCKRFFKDQNRSMCNIIDYDIAMNLNFLPFEHFLLVSYMMVFLRKVCQKSINNSQFDKESLKVVVNYYCGSMFMRPYRPGEKVEAMFPLLLYLIVRWRRIQVHCNQIGHPAYFLEKNFMDYSSMGMMPRIDQWVQTDEHMPYFQTEIVEVYRNIPHYVPKEEAVTRSTGCQTEVSLEEKAVQSSNSPEYIEAIDIKANDEAINSTCLLPVPPPCFATQQSQTELPLTELISKKNGTNELDYNEMTFFSAADYSDIHLNELETSIELHVSDVDNRSESNINNNIDQGIDVASPSKNTDISFFSTIESSTPSTWQDVMKETSQTVKKVEEYIYDDYETFKKEDYNQIGVKRSTRKSKSLVEKCSKVGWTYTPPETRREAKESDPEKTTGDSEEKDPEEINSYFESSYHKFSDHNPDSDVKSKKNKRKMQVVYDFPKSKKSDEEVAKKDSKRKINFNLKKFKLNLDFFRVITPRPPRHSYSTKMFAEDSDVKYKKIKNENRAAQYI
ncbi:unnamed protein product [Callosobruchus maculatus]|uniref:Glycoside hydrolase family 1 protein n=1 Tax=Callosobruchus maculatus TaxID=64391 RepID=A0A653DLM6_CALMS|nr:unnamed protein product [Callosobruchus maculatus]